MFFRFLLVLLIFCSSIVSTYSLSQRNRISIHTGLFHTFFDASPILNVNYTNSKFKPFNGVFYSSIGVQYRREIIFKFCLSFEYNFYDAIYRNIVPKQLKNRIYNRKYHTFNLHLSKLFSIGKKTSLSLGIGLNYRYGNESILTEYISSGSAFILEGRNLNDIGINGRLGIEFVPIKWFSLFTSIDMIGFLYFYDKNRVKKIQNVFNNKKYPHTMDLSWRFGLGFNF